MCPIFFHYARYQKLILLNSEPKKKISCELDFRFNFLIGTYSTGGEKLRPNLISTFIGTSFARLNPKGPKRAPGSSEGRLGLVVSVIKPPGRTDRCGKARGTGTRERISSLLTEPYWIQFTLTVYGEL